MVDVTAFERVERFCERYGNWLVLACVLLGTVLRARGLETYWLSPDEGTYLDAVTAPTWTELGRKIGSQPHPPLFHVVLRPIALATSDIALMRLPSLVFGSLAILGVSLLARAAAGGVAGIVAGLLTAVSPAAILLSQVLRPYSLQLVTLSFGLWFLIRYLRRKPRSGLFGFSLFMCLALLTHYSSALILLAADVLVLGLLLARRLPRDQLKPLCLAHLPLAVLLLALYFLHLRPGALAQPFGVPPWLEPFLHEKPADLWLAWIDLHRYIFGSAYAALSILLAILGFLAVAARRGATLAALAATSLLVAAIASLLQVYPFGNVRQASYLAVIVIPLVAQGVVFLLGRRGSWQIITSFALALLLIFPGAADRAIGSPRPAPNVQVEQFSLAEVIRNLGPLFRKIQTQPGILILDQQTYFALLPQFARAGAALHGDCHPGCPLDIEGVGIDHFHWGSARVLVNPAWRLRGGEQRPRNLDHVVGFTQHVDAAFPSLALREQRAGWIFLVGGLHQFENLVALDRSGPASLRFLSGIRRHRGLGIARLDPSRLLRRFDAGSDRPRTDRGSVHP